MAFIFLLWVQSLFTDTVHSVENGTHIFRYNAMPWFFLALMFIMQIGFAEIARRFMKDRVLAVLCLLGIPLFGLLSLQLIYERTEVSETQISHRRDRLVDPLGLRVSSKVIGSLSPVR
jgi:fucose 4-O-acetylase-like acetyltransferase